MPFGHVPDELDTSRQIQQRIEDYLQRKRPVKTVASYGRFRENGREVGMTGGGWIVLKKAPLQNVAKQSNFEYFDRA